MKDSERLLNILRKAYEEHGSIIIGFDYDDTVYPHSVSDWALRPVRSVLQRAKKQGHALVLTTNNKDIKKCLEFCEKYEITPHAINTNVVKAFEKQSKVYANIYLDDKSLLFETLKVLNAFLKETAKD